MLCFFSKILLFKKGKSFAFLLFSYQKVVLKSEYFIFDENFVNKYK